MLTGKSQSLQFLIESCPLMNLFLQTTVSSKQTPRVVNISWHFDLKSLEGTPMLWNDTPPLPAIHEVEYPSCVCVGEGGKTAWMRLFVFYLITHLDQGNIRDSRLGWYILIGLLPSDQGESLELRWWCLTSSYGHDCRVLINYSTKSQYFYCPNDWSH